MGVMERAFASKGGTTQVSDLEYLKGFHSIKEVSDIISDIERLDSLSRNRMWSQLQEHIRAVSNKYPVERAAHNATHIVPPETLEQAAQNCRRFLINLGKAKITTEGLKHLSETSRKKWDQQNR